MSGCCVCVQVAASLLLFMEEEDAFWMMCAIIEDLLPASYYCNTLIGIQVQFTYQFKQKKTTNNWKITVVSNSSSKL